MATMDMKKTSVNMKMTSHNMMGNAHFLKQQDDISDSEDEHSE